MLEQTKSVNKNGTITTEAGEVVAHLSSYVEDNTEPNGGANVSINVVNKKQFCENKEMVKEDVNQFINEFLSDIGGSEA